MRAKNIFQNARILQKCGKLARNKVELKAPAKNYQVDGQHKSTQVCLIILGSPIDRQTNIAGNVGLKV